MSDAYPEGPYNFYSTEHPDSEPQLCLLVGHWCYFLDCSPPRRISRLMATGRLVRLAEFIDVEERKEARA